MPHKDRVDGTVRSTKPLSYGGTLIEDFSMTFEGGRVVKADGRTRRDGAAATRSTPMPGAARLGEVALVPHNSPVAQSGLLFYNTLFDENAASHVALGSAYKFTVAGGEGMSDEQFEAGRRQPQRDARRFHDRLGATRYRRRAARRHRSNR